MRRTLTLRRDTLAGLSPDELLAIHGAAATAGCLTILTCSPPCHTVV